MVFCLHQNDIRILVVTEIISVIVFVVAQVLAPIKSARRDNPDTARNRESFDILTVYKCLLPDFNHGQSVMRFRNNNALRFAEPISDIIGYDISRTFFIQFKNKRNLFPFRIESDISGDGIRESNFVAVTAIRIGVPAGKGLHVIVRVRNRCFFYDRGIDGTVIQITVSVCIKVHLILSRRIRILGIVGACDKPDHA